MDGADMLLIISASPGRGLTAGHQIESARWVEYINQTYASFFTTFIMHINRVGYEDGVNFWGGTTIHDPNGARVIRDPYFEEAPVFQEIDLNQLHRTRARIPLRRDERTALTHRELSRILIERPSLGKKR